MIKNFSTNMNTSTFSFLVLLAGFFIFAPQLPCGFCKEKTEQTRHKKDSTSYVSDPKNWNSWPSQAWFIPEAPEGIPLSLEQQQKIKSQKQQLKNNQNKERRTDEDINIDDLRKKAFKYGKILFDFVTGTGGNNGLRNFFPDSPSTSSFSSRQSEGTGRAGVVDWLGRLIGIQGKSLGEFLREYQVHVLYDLVFTFFKWVFFLYAGLLIP